MLHAKYQSPCIGSLTSGRDVQGEAPSGGLAPLERSRHHRCRQRSIQERYGNFSTYYYTLQAAIENMVSQRMLLPADSATLFNAGLQRALNAGLAPTEKEAAELGLGSLGTDAEQ